jgi:hypothetical protein
MPWGRSEKTRVKSKGWHQQSAKAKPHGFEDLPTSVLITFLFPLALGGLKDRQPSG